jgi:hypothetical protein
MLKGLAEIFRTAPTVQRRDRVLMRRMPVDQQFHLHPNNDKQAVIPFIYSWENETLRL